MTSKAFILRHPLLSYFGLTFILAWAGSFIVIGPKFLRGDIIQFEDVGFIGAVMLLAPFLVGGFLTYICDGKPGLRDLFSRMKIWRVGGRWYVALLIFPILILLVLLALTYLVSPAFLPNFFVAGVFIGLIVGFLEETGWMGFAYPRMEGLHSALATALLLGFLHVLWHLAADYLGASGSQGAYWLPRFLAFCVAMIAMRVILVWVYANTKSLLLAQLMHASSTGFLLVLVPLSLTPAQDTLFYLVYAVALGAAALLIVARYGKDLRSKHDQEQRQEIYILHQAAGKCPQQQS